MAPIWFTFATTKERIKLPKHDSTFKQDAKVLLQNASRVFLAIACVVIIVGLIARFSSVTFYVKYYMLDDDQVIVLIFDSVAVFPSLGLFGQFVGAIFTPYLTKLYNKHYLVLIACLVHTVLLILSCFIPPEQY